MGKVDFDQIRRQVNIVQIINNYVPLARHGSGYVGLCPFHNDKNPSLQVSQEKQIYKCFSCGAAGNVFTFVQNYEKIPFINAVKKVCDIAGLKVEGLEEKEEGPSFSRLETKLMQLLQDLTIYYNYQLKVDIGSEALSYLHSRGLTDKEIEDFKIGFAPSDGHLTVKFLQSKAYSLDEIISAGVGVEISPGEVVDRLRGRLIFPLTDTYGRPIAYSGRRLKKEDSEQKYINTPETLLFHKSDVLYNYQQALNHARQEEAVYVVEGFMDAITLTRVGLKAVVATMGTALTNEHLRLLQSLRSEIRLFFDADKAGATATYRTLEALSRTRLKVRVVKPLVGVKDIDELYQTKGAAAVTKAAKETMGAIDFVLYYLEGQHNLENHEDCKRYLNKASTYLAGSQIDDLDREHYINLLSQKTKFSKTLIQRLVKGVLSKADSKMEKVLTSNRIKSQRQSKNLNRFEQADHQIIQLLLTDGWNIVKFDSLGISLYSKMCRDLASLIVQKYCESKGDKKVELADLYSAMPQEMITLVNQIMSESYPPSSLDELAKVVVDDLASKRHEKSLEQQILEVDDLKKQTELAEELINKRRLKSRRINKED
ncbi:MAG: DNA primase [Bacilli bacterium]|jgi:DNA primase